MKLAITAVKPTRAQAKAIKAVQKAMKTNVGYLVIEARPGPGPTGDILFVTVKGV